MRRLHRRDYLKRLSPGQKKALLKPVQLQPARVRLITHELLSKPVVESIPEKDFQALVVGAAQALGWLAYHVPDSRKSTPGWPDLALVREGAFLVAELKSQTGRVRPEQEVWLELMRSAGISAYLWRPSDWSEVVLVLAGTQEKTP